MSTINFVQPRARFFDSNGQPLSYGRVFFYEAGTNTLKNVYADYDGTILTDNPQPLDADGFVENAAGVRLGQGLYDIRVEENHGGGVYSTYYTYPNIEGANVSNLGRLLQVGHVDTIAELRALPTSLDYDLIFVHGYYERGDGGARLMRYVSASTEVENNGTVIVPDSNPGTGRWHWVPQNGDVAVTPQLFGAFPSDGTLVVASQIDNMINWCLSNNQHKAIHFNLAGDYHINSSSNFSGDLQVTIDSGVKFLNTGTGITLTFTCEALEMKGLQQFAQPSPTSTSVGMVFQTKQPMDVHPEWFGVQIDDTLDHGFVIDSLITNTGTQHRIVFARAGAYMGTTDSWDFSNHTVVFKEGAYIDCDGTSITMGEIQNESNQSIFRGSDSQSVLFAKNYAKQSWFDNKTADVWNTGWLTTFITTNVDDNNFLFHIDQLCKLSEALTEFQIGDKVLRFDWEFGVDGFFEIVSGGAIDFGRIYAGEQKILSSSIFGDKKMQFQQDVKLVWFGGNIVIGNEVDNQNALRSAYENVCYSNDASNTRVQSRIALDLSGNAYKTNGFTTTATEGNFYIKNGTIYSDDSNPMTLSNGIHARNCRFEWRNNTADMFVIQDNSSSFRGCYIKGDQKVIDSLSTDLLTIRDCEILQGNSVASDIDVISHAGRAVIENNEITRTHNASTGEGFVDLASGSVFDKNVCDSITVKMTDKGSIRNNTLDRGRIVLNNPMQLVVRENNLTTSDDLDVEIELVSTVTDFVSQGLIIENNSFIDGVDPVARTAYSCIHKTGSWLGNSQRVTIRNNDLNPGYLKAMATEFNLTIFRTMTEAANHYHFVFGVKETDDVPYFCDLVYDASIPLTAQISVHTDNVGNYDGFIQAEFGGMSMGNFEVECDNINAHADTFTGYLNMFIIVSQNIVPNTPDVLSETIG